MTPFRFDPTTYGPAVAALLAVPRVAALGPGTPDVAVRPALERCALPPACRAGLWLYFDFLDEAHQICQDDESDPDRNFWHAVMHRREPDPSNSKYWWRRAGAHPVLGKLVEHAPALGYIYTNPFDFVDLCEKVRGLGNAQEELAKRVQLLEWQLHFAWCFERSGA